MHALRTTLTPSPRTIIEGIFKPLVVGLNHIRKQTYGKVQAFFAETNFTIISSLKKKQETHEL